MLLLKAHINFNSIKVRLELIVLMAVCLVLNYFNSIKVRLEPSKRFVFAADTLFQFHKGAIRTLRLILVLHRLLNFNSIKVRLELLLIILFLSWIPYFNSIKVRLEPETLSVKK